RAALDAARRDRGARAVHEQSASEPTRTAPQRGSNAAGEREAFQPRVGPTRVLKAGDASGICARVTGPAQASHVAARGADELESLSAEVDGAPDLVLAGR